MVAVVDLSVIDEAFGPTSDLYTDVLGVKSNASGEQIQRAYFERRNDLFGLLADMDAEEQDSITESHRFHAERQLDAVVMTLRILGDPSARSQYDDLRDDRTSGVLGGGQPINNSAASVAAMMKKTSSALMMTTTRSYSMEAEEVAKVVPNHHHHSHKHRNHHHRRLKSRRSRGVPPPPDPPSSIPHGGSSVSSGLDYPQPPSISPSPSSPDNDDDDNDDDDDDESRNNRNSPVRMRRAVSEKQKSPSPSPSSEQQQKQHRSSNNKRRTRKVTPEQVRPRPPKQKSSKQQQQQQQPLKPAVVASSSLAKNKRGGDVSDTEESAFTLETVRTEEQRTLDKDKEDNNNNEADEVVTLGTYTDDASFMRMQQKRSMLQMVHDEIVGAIDDTSRSVEQVFSAFTLSDSDIKAVCSRIDRALIQMNRTLKG